MATSGPADVSQQRGLGTRAGARARAAARLIVWVVGWVVAAAVLGWLFPRAAWAGVVLLVIAALVVARNVVVALRRPTPTVGLLSVAASLVVATALAALFVALLPDPSTPGRISDDELLPDARGDCEPCSEAEDIVAVGLRADGDGLDINIETASPMDRGDGFELLFNTATDAPVLFERGNEGWLVTVPDDAPIALDGLTLAEDDTVLIVRIPGSGQLPGLAVVSPGGDRAPDRGSLDGSEG